MSARVSVSEWLAVCVLLAAPSAAAQEHRGVIIKFDGASGQYLGDFVPACSGGLDMPQSVTFGPDGNLYVTSWFSHSVKRYDGGTGAYLGDFIPPGLGGLENPDELKFGPDGNAYVSARFQGQILRYDGATGAFLDVFVSDENLGGFANFTFGPEGDIYAGMFNGDHHILRYDGATGVPLGPFDQGGPVLGNAYAGLAFGPDGNLYAVRMHDRSVQKYDGTTGQYLGYFIPPGNPDMTSPRDSRFRADGRVFVVDQGDASVGHDFGSILEFTAEGEYVGRFDHGRPSAFRQSSDLEFGSDGNLCVAGIETAVSGTEAVSEVYIGAAAAIAGGWMLSSFTVPSVRPAEHGGIVTALSADGREMTDAAANWEDGQFDDAHYVVFSSGLLVSIVGTRAADQTLELATPVTGVSVGDEYRIRKHWTVASVFGPVNETGLLPGLDCEEADTVLLGRSIFHSSAAGSEGWRYCDGGQAEAHRICPGLEIVVERKAPEEVVCYTSGEAVSLADHQPPVITCPADLTLSCDESTDPRRTGSATATDNCDLTPTLAYSDVVEPGACAAAFVVTRTWTATDACGNLSSCVQVVTAGDPVPPTVECPPNVVVPLGAPTDPDVTGWATACDSCDSNPTLTTVTASRPVASAHRGK